MPRPLKIRGSGNYGIETAALQRILRKVSQDSTMDADLRKAIITALNESIGLFNKDTVHAIDRAG